MQTIVWQATRTMSDPADLINVAVEQLIVERFELPAYGTLDELVNHIRHQAHQELYTLVTANLTEEQEFRGVMRATLAQLANIPGKQSVPP